MIRLAAQFDSPNVASAIPSMASIRILSLLMADNTNKHVWDYLTYYLGLAHAPGFAVLLSGPWGVGKTHLLDAFLKGYFRDRSTSYVYVSLYGLSTIEEIDDALFQASFPALTGTTAKMAGRLARIGLKHFLNIDAGELNMKELLKKFNPRVYVFDDLERSEAPINKVIGYINQFVEHGEAKVIVIANEIEISPDEDYTRRREKLIGKTLQVNSAFDEAFGDFSSKIVNLGARRFIQNSAVDIATIYHQSELNNLRILQQTMWDFERFYAALLPEHHAHDEAMATLLRLLFVLSFEFKGARIVEEDIATDRGMAARVRARLDRNKPQTPIMRAGTRYPMADIDDDILSNRLLIDYLVRGIIDMDAIRAELSASRYFIKVSDEEPCRTVWHWLERSDAEFDAAVVKMEKQFVAREFTKAGKIVHIFGLRLFLSDRGLLPLSRADVVAEGKQYIDDIYAAKTLEFLPPDAFSEERSQGWGGLGNLETDTAEYIELFQYLSFAMHDCVLDGYTETATKLLSKMSSDVDSFYRQVSLSYADTSQYVWAPVLAKLPVDDFVNAFLALHPNVQRMAMAALKGRYADGRIDRELKEEKPWIMSVHDALVKRLPELGRLSRYRLEQQLRWYLQLERVAEDSD
jgi:hypothetical protein